MNKGFSTLFIVIILGSMVLALALAFSNTSLFVLKSSSNFENSAKARGIVNACSEIALEKIKIDNDYLGSETLLIDSYECSYEITNQGGNNRLISVSSTIKNAVRKINIQTNSFNPLNISFWQEI